METAGRFECVLGQWQDESVMVLRDNQSGAMAMVAPALGSNCVAWTVRQNAQDIQVIETPASPQVLHTRASRGGVPVLWPFPGRVRDAHYTYKGHEYHLPPTDKDGINHIHGLALTAQWQVSAYGGNEKGAYLVTTLGPDQLAPEGKAGYPFNFLLTLRFELSDYSLSYLVELENKETQTTIPFSFGIHPYFRAPLIPVGGSLDANARSRCPVRIPATAHWPTNGGIPNGPAQPSTTDQDFQNWRDLGDQHFDDMYTQPIWEDKGGHEVSVAGYRTPELGLEVQIQADANFRDWVLFTPAERAAIAIEPYTSPPNAINSAPQGLAGSNLLELGAGNSWQARVVMQVLPYSSH